MNRLTVRDLCVDYRTKTGDIRAVDRVSFDIHDGEIFGIVGESGCGKSTLAATILRLLDETGEISAGSIEYGDIDLATATEKELRGVRGKEISMIFQDPDSSLDPVYTIGEQITETLETHLGLKGKTARDQAVKLLSQVGIPSPEERLDDYPYAFSGGMRQRVVLAIALSCDPGLLIADEPTTALDVSIQAQILDLFEDINEQFGTSIVLITHDLGVIAEVCDRVGVMYAGNLVEVGGIEQIFEAPKHPYTVDLFQSLPELYPVGSELPTIKGTPPDLISPPEGCKYHPRCTKVCSEECEHGDIPPIYQRDGADVRCYLYDAELNPDFEEFTPVGNWEESR